MKYKPILYSYILHKTVPARRFGLITEYGYNVNNSNMQVKTLSVI